MRGPDTRVEKMSEMYRNLFKAGAYLINHLMDRSLEFKNGSKDVFTEPQLKHTTAIILQRPFNSAQIVMDYFQEISGLLQI